MQLKTNNLKVRQGQETAERLLDIARQSFAVKGFAATRTEDIIAEAHVTKGALYHHFPSKLHLFEAVYRIAEDSVARRIDIATASVADPWEKLLEGCFAYLDACADKGLQRILRIDGPAVLGLEKWAAIDREYGLDRLLPALQQMADANLIDVPSVEALAWQLSGAMNEASFWVARHNDPTKALRESQNMLRTLLSGILA